MTYVFTCPMLGCDADLEPSDGFAYWCPREELEIPSALVAGDAWGEEQ